MSKFRHALERSRSGASLTPEEVFSLLDGDDLPAIMAAAAERRDRAHGSIVSYSRKVFIPLRSFAAIHVTIAPSHIRRELAAAFI